MRNTASFHDLIDSGTYRKPKMTLKDTVVQRSSVKKLFLKISQNSQENTCARVSSLIKLQTSKFYEIFKNSFFYRTPSSTASALTMGDS